jgi:hypothetical protein
MPPQTPTDAPDPNAGVLLNKWGGMHNTVNPERLDPNELAVGLNIDIDDRQQAHRRRGFHKALSGVFHSAYTLADGRVIVVKDGTLVLVHPNFSTVALQAGMGLEPVAYAQVAENVYFTSLAVSGRLNTTTLQVSPWGAEVSAGQWISPVVNPTDTLAQVRGRLLGAPPLASDITYWNGRIYLAHGRVLWATELYLYNYVDKTKNYKYFETEIQVVGSVTDGIYVGCEDQIWWLEGTFNEMKRIPLMSARAIPGSLVTVPADLVNPQVPQDQYTGSKNAVVFMTDRGLVAGLDNGQLFNLTWTEYQFPNMQSGAALFRQQDGVNQYVGVFDSGGDPNDSARMGDFVDAEIRRVGDWGYLADGVKFSDRFTVQMV